MLTEAQIKRRAYYVKYRKSENGKAATRKYRESQKGQEVVNRANKIARKKRFLKRRTSVSALFTRSLIAKLLREGRSPVDIAMDRMIPMSVVLKIQQAVKQ